MTSPAILFRSARRDSNIATLTPNLLLHHPCPHVSSLPTAPMLDAFGDPAPVKPFIVNFVLYSIAIVATVFRLIHRLHRRQFYWDDFWALFALISVIILVVRLAVTFAVPIKNKPIAVQSFLVWVIYVLHPAIIWSVRLSIGTTIVRFLPQGRNRSITKWSCFAMGLMWIVNSVQKIFMCGLPVPAVPYAYLCPVTRLTPAIGLATNLIANVWLIVWPAWILFNMRLPPTYRRIIIACFSTSVFIAVVNILHDVFNIKNDYAKVALTAHVQVALALFLCNILVLVSYLYRIFRDPQHHTSQSTATQTCETESGSYPNRSKWKKYSSFSFSSSRSRSSGPASTTVDFGRTSNDKRCNDDKHANADSGATTNDYPLTSFGSSTGPLTSLGSEECDREFTNNHEYDDDVHPDSRVYKDSRVSWADMQVSRGTKQSYATEESWRVSLTDIETHASFSPATSPSKGAIEGEDSGMTRSNF